MQQQAACRQKGPLDAAAAARRQAVRPRRASGHVAGSVASGPCTRAGCAHMLSPRITYSPSTSCSTPLCSRERGGEQAGGAWGGRGHRPMVAARRSAALLLLHAWTGAGMQGASCCCASCSRQRCSHRPWQGMAQQGAVQGTQDTAGRAGPRQGTAGHQHRAQQPWIATERRPASVPWSCTPARGTRPGSGWWPDRSRAACPAPIAKEGTQVGGRSEAGEPGRRRRSSGGGGPRVGCTARTAHHYCPPVVGDH